MVPEQSFCYVFHQKQALDIFQYKIKLAICFSQTFWLKGFVSIELFVKPLNFHIANFMSYLTLFSPTVLL